MPRFRTLTIGLGALLGLVLPIVASAPVAAQKVGSGTFHDDDTHVEHNFCGVSGLDVEVDATADGRFLERLQGRESIFYYMDRVRSEVVLTNVGTGQQATDISRHVTRKDLRITVNEDGTITITSLFTGQEALYGDAGKLIAKGDGQVRFSQVIDYQGTLSDPEDDIPLTEPELIFGSTGTNDDFCAAILADWGISG